MTERIYCGSDVIEEALIEKHSLYEYPDGLMVDKSDCQRCLINCPNNPKGYIKADILKLNISRYKTQSF